MFTRTVFYITISSFDMADVQLPIHQNVAEVVIEPEEVVHVKNERFLYTFGDKVTRSAAP